MEEIITELAVSSDEKLLRESAMKAYQVIQRYMETSIDFETFFDGQLKRAFSFELAARDAVIYYCSTLFDSENLQDAYTEVFRIDAKKLAFIISQHQERMNGKGVYYRIFMNKLIKPDAVKRPCQRIPQTAVSNLHLEEYVKMLSGMLFEEILEKTGVSKDSILEKNHVPEIAACRTLFLNTFLAQTRPVKLKIIGRCINSDHSGVIYHRKKHQDYLEKYQDDPEALHPRTYMELYNYITARVKKRLDNK